MADEIVIVDRVTVDVDGLGDLSPGSYAAIPVSTPLQAAYTDGERSWTRTVHGFTGNGSPLVFDKDNARLVPAATALLGKGGRFRRVMRAEPPMTGPFTPAPTGLVAVFEGDQKRPVVYYDLYGRPVLLSNDADRSLYLATKDEAFVRIEGGPAVES